MVKVHRVAAIFVFNFQYFNVLYWEVFIIEALYLYTMLSETGSAVRCFVSTFKISQLDTFTSLTAPSILSERHPSLRTEIIQFF